MSTNFRAQTFQNHERNRGLNSLGMTRAVGESRCTTAVLPLALTLVLALPILIQPVGSVAVHEFVESNFKSNSGLHNTNTTTFGVTGVPDGCVSPLQCNARACQDCACVDGKCKCADGFSGDTCQTPFCVNRTDGCSGHGECVVTPTSITCKCDTNFTGPTCANETHCDLKCVHGGAPNDDCTQCDGCLVAWVGPTCNVYVTLPLMYDVQVDCSCLFACEDRNSVSFNGTALLILLCLLHTLSADPGTTRL